MVTRTAVGWQTSTTRTYHGLTWRCCSISIGSFIGWSHALLWVAIQHIVLTALHLLFWAVAFASSRMGSVQRSRVNLWCGKSKGKEVVAIVFFFCFCCRSHALLWVGNPGHCVDCTGFGALGSGVWTLANRDFSDYVDRLINYFVSQKTCQHYKDN